MNIPVKTSVLGVGLTHDTSENILEYVVDLVENSKKKSFIVTPNPEMIVATQKSPTLQKLLNSADLALCDGTGLYLASYLVARGVPERIAGVDFMKSLCENVSKKPISIGFLGGGPNVAEEAAECLLSLYPTLKVVFVGEKWGEEGFNWNAKNQELPQGHYLLRRVAGIRNNGEKNKKKNAEAPNSKFIIPNSKEIDILFVAFGFPKQEQWIAEHLEKLPIRVAMGVGGAFDYLSGRVSRAPFFLRSLGLEWLYRLVRQPWRIKRQLALVEFTGLVLKAKFAK